MGARPESQEAWAGASLPGGFPAGDRSPPSTLPGPQVAGGKPSPTRSTDHERLPPPEAPAVLGRCSLGAVRSAPAADSRASHALESVARTPGGKRRCRTEAKTTLSSTPEGHDHPRQHPVRLTLPEGWHGLGGPSPGELNPGPVTRSVTVRCLLTQQGLHTSLSPALHLLPPGPQWAPLFLQAACPGGLTQLQSAQGSEAAVSLSSGLWGEGLPDHRPRLGGTSGHRLLHPALGSGGLGLGNLGKQVQFAKGDGAAEMGQALRPGRMASGEGGSQEGPLLSPSDAVPLLEEWCFQRKKFGLLEDINF